MTAQEQGELDALRKALNGAIITTLMGIGVNDEMLKSWLALLGDHKSTSLLKILIITGKD